MVVEVGSKGLGLKELASAGEGPGLATAAERQEAAYRIVEVMGTEHAIATVSSSCLSLSLPLTRAVSSRLTASRSYCVSLSPAHALVASRSHCISLSLKKGTILLCRNAASSF